MKKAFKQAIEANNTKLPLSFSFIEVSTVKKKSQPGKVAKSPLHQTDTFRLDQFHKSLNIDIPDER